MLFRFDIKPRNTTRWLDAHSTYLIWYYLGDLQSKWWVFLRSRYSQINLFLSVSCHTVELPTHKYWLNRCGIDFIYCIWRDDASKQKILMGRHTACYSIAHQWFRVSYDFMNISNVARTITVLNREIRVIDSKKKRRNKRTWNWLIKRINSTPCHLHFDSKIT